MLVISGHTSATQLWYSLLPIKYCESRGIKVNKAHAVEYAHICYRNAYLKSNYPVAFYTALLNSEIGNSKRQSVIIRDMMKNGIELLPPLINQSGSLFTMTDKHIIRFGLGAIKGLGDKALQAIFDEQAQRGDFKSVEDFRARIPATLCNVQVMTNLAKCGAFDHMLDKCLQPMKNRATLVESMKGLNDAINKLKQKKGKKSAPSIEEIIWKINNGHVMYPLVEADEDLIEYATWEKQVLNYFISAHPMDAYTGEIERWTAVQDTEMEDLPSEFYIAGFLAAYHETTIKKEGRNKGKKMGFVTIETEFRSYEATMFPGIWESCLPYMKVGNAVVLKGRRDNYKGKVSIQGLYMRHLINSGIRDCPECHIRLKESNVFDIIQLKQMFDQHPGMTQVYIHITVKHYDITIQCNQSIALNDRIIDFCNQIGKIAYKPI